MSAPQNIIAVVFDFDDTLTDDSTTKLLAHHEIDTDDFWKVKIKALVDDGWDPTLGYLKLILDNVGPDKPLGNLSNKKLREFGAALPLYRGLPKLFSDLKKLTSHHPVSNPVIEFYIISGGIEEVIRGSKIANHVNGIWGCRFAETDGVISHIKNVITFTEKTRFLFEINKGIADPNRTNPYQVNQDVPASIRRIPLGNMIYVGDGLTDVPCFSLLNKAGGEGFGVFDPSRAGSPKKAWEQLAAPHRVTSLNAPKYGPRDELGALLRVAVQQMCMRLDVRAKTA
jgi:phosphoserine phosphatase